jgi:hypothetical protein
LTSRFSKEFDNDFESILKQINLESLSKPMQIDHTDDCIVSKDDVLVYNSKTWSDRLPFQTKSGSDTSHCLIAEPLAQVATIENMRRHTSLVPKINLEPVYLAQRLQNMQEMTSIPREDLNLNEKKRIKDRLGILTPDRQIVHQPVICVEESGFD